MRRRTLVLTLLVALLVFGFAGLALAAPPQPVAPDEVTACRVRITGFTTEGTSAEWQLENHGSADATTSRVVVRYPFENGAIKEALLGETPFWSGETTTNPAVLTPSGDPADRTVAANGGQATLTIEFANQAAAAPYHITITFSQGCAATSTETGIDLASFHGVIKSITPGATEAEGTLTVETPRALETVNVTTETQIHGDHGLTLKFSDLEAGMVIGVRGTRNEDGSVDAHRIDVRLPVVEFAGTVLSKPADGYIGTWRIGAATVEVDGNTEIEGDPQVGSLVRVTGIRQGDGTVRALRIRVVRDPHENQVVRFRGPIEAFGDTEWTVAGVTFNVDENTEIVGTPEVGKIAWVRAEVQADGSLRATRIIVSGRSQGEVVFRGPILEITPEYWMVGTVKVNITAETTIVGTPAVGLKAVVRGQVQSDRSVTATRIVVQEEAPQEGPLVEFEGTVESMPEGGTTGQWTFTNVQVKRGGPLDEPVTVVVDELTFLDESRGTLEVGATARVNAIRAGETLRALRIRATGN